MYAVFDGLGWISVPRKLRRELHKRLDEFFQTREPVESLREYAKSLKDEIIHEFVMYDEELCAHLPIGGSTAAVLLFIDDLMYMVNLGDSRIVVDINGQRYETEEINRIIKEKEKELK